MRFVNSAIKMSDTAPEIRCPAPTLGQHNDDVFVAVLGYTPEKIRQMKEDGII